MRAQTAYVLARNEAEREGKEAAAVGQNARQMVINRDGRFVDLAALVSQLSGDMHASALTVADVATGLRAVVAALADNAAADAATRAELAAVGESLQDVDDRVTQVVAEYARLDAELDAATAQLAASDVELAARITAAEQAVRDEATTRAAADAAEAATRAAADAAEARARADADAADQKKAADAVAAEAAARIAADASEVAARAAADTALSARVAALENGMPAVASGRAARTALTIGAGATVDVPVAFDAPLPDTVGTNYVPVVVIDVPNVGQWSIDSFPAKTKTGVTVRLRSTAAIVVAITLNITVIALKF